jgi:hypothetical protein
MNFYEKELASTRLAEREESGKCREQRKKEVL